MPSRKRSISSSPFRRSFGSAPRGVNVPLSGGHCLFRQAQLTQQLPEHSAPPPHISSPGSVETSTVMIADLTNVVLPWNDPEVFNETLVLALISFISQPSACAVAVCLSTSELPGVPEGAAMLSVTDAIDSAKGTGCGHQAWASPLPLPLKLNGCGGGVCPS